MRKAIYIVLTVLCGAIPLIGLLGNDIENNKRNIYIVIGILLILYIWRWYQNYKKNRNRTLVVLIQHVDERILDGAELNLRKIRTNLIKILRIKDITIETGSFHACIKKLQEYIGKDIIVILEKNTYTLENRAYLQEKGAKLVYVFDGTEERELALRTEVCIKHFIRYSAFK